MPLIKLKFPERQGSFSLAVSTKNMLGRACGIDKSIIGNLPVNLDFLPVSISRDG
jgi:hypothetical protein